MTIANFAGNPIYIEDLRSRVKYSYDGLQRPKEVRVTENGASRVAEKFVYGELYTKLWFCVTLLLKTFLAKNY